ncbi:hypothetical protein C1T17_19565 [Sphingobium sp. SCG-1]|uniref:hypothetical protein n=1 Tax=Sphingobium sp. SCG-1 TaxID=2072936 RepID=UPI000CD6A061|nr:hypothetical protein [Sphingobium sp. SCG-1]AUW59944.1 hypothetical protein C1T17_19565 [Sphingobium sp. SCG-1]
MPLLHRSGDQASIRRKIGKIVRLSRYDVVLASIDWLCGMEADSLASVSSNQEAIMAVGRAS